MVQIMQEIELLVFVRMQKDGKGRRKKKDPESRDFSCLCGKSYLSYAAAYTHAKNKHQGEKQFIDGIVKPQREQLKRGRPKEKKVQTQTQQTERLTLIESTILKICECLKDVFAKTVLEGNEERDQSEFETCFRVICQQFSKDQNMEFDHLHSEDQSFANALIKDFCSDIAARVKFCTLYISSGEFRSVESSVAKLNEFGELWRERGGVNEAIGSALVAWRNMGSEGQLLERQGLEEDDFDI